MNDKLLRAFIEASGFCIETTEEFTYLYKQEDLQPNGEPKEFAPYETIKKVDYKVTKKGFMSGLIDNWKDLTDCEKLIVLKDEIKQLQEVPYEKD